MELVQKYNRTIYLNDNVRYTHIKYTKCSLGDKMLVAIVTYTCFSQLYDKSFREVSGKLDGYGRGHRVNRFPRSLGTGPSTRPKEARRMSWAGERRATWVVWRWPTNARCFVIDFLSGDNDLSSSLAQPQLHQPRSDARSCVLVLSLIS